MESVTRLLLRGSRRDRQVYSLAKLHLVLDSLVREGGLRAVYTNFLKLIQTSHICQRCDSKDLSQQPCLVKTPEDDREQLSWVPEAA